MIFALSIKFTRPIFLLLLILFLAFTIIPYFTLSKRYRKTRNRITSMVLHAIVSLLVVLMVSGATFVRTLSNPSNEIILLVDVSNTEEQASESRDDFIETIINQCKFDDFKVGIVTFGYDQEYAVPLTKDYKNIYKNYLEASLPDTSATNYASALLYAKDLFTNGDAGKIVLITDGKETDDNAKSVIKGIVASGIKIDTVYIPSSYEAGQDFEIVNVNMPDYHVNKGDECTITIDLYSNYEGVASINLYDNEEKDILSTVVIEVKEGLQTVELKHTFLTDGLHEVSFEIENHNDLIEQNNEYTSYYYLEVFNKVLIIEQEEGSSTLLYNMMTENNDYQVTMLNITIEDAPQNAVELCIYDEIIMNNIANSDLPDGFAQVLNEYVSTYGGGLFTTGGSDKNDETIAHAYNRNDMIGTLYQQMLPVQAINYTPPVGVIVIIDRSGSMGITDDSGSTMLDWAKAGAVSCLNSLTDRDYFGIMTLESDYDTILPLTPRTQESKILSAINSIDKSTGGTVFPGAVDRAGQALRALKAVDKKHIIIVTDGQVPVSEVPQYEAFAQNYYDTDGITISVIGVSMTKPSNSKVLEAEDYPYTNIGTNTPYEKMLRLTKITHGRLHVIESGSNEKLVSEMREDLNAPDIKEINFESFYPQVTDVGSSLFSGVEILNDDTHANTLSVQLDGFYGTKVRSAADMYIIGDYNVPIYAQWKYGKGMVGSFMCDLSGKWSSEFMNSESGKKLLFNIINNLTPTESIRTNDIKLVLYEDNYINSLSIYTTLDEGEYLKGSVNYTIKGQEYSVSLNEVNSSLTKEELRMAACYTTSSMNADNNYSRTKFTIREAGAYTITVEKYNSNNELIGSNKIEKSFAYSEEYDVLVANGNIDYQAYLDSLAKSGNGILIVDNEDPHEIIDSFDTVLVKEFDPRYLFSILAIILFLLDIAVRKFKFKWPHEIIKKWKDNRK